MKLRLRTPNNRPLALKPRRPKLLLPMLPKRLVDRPALKMEMLLNGVDGRRWRFCAVHLLCGWIG